MTIWNWEQCSPSRLPGRFAAEMRRAALIQVLVVGSLGAAIFFWWGHHQAAILIWGLAAAFLFLGMFLPRQYRHIHAVGALLGRLVGKSLLYILLVPCYWLLFSFIALILRISRRDPLHRQVLPTGLSYWWPRRLENPAVLYDKQFMQEDRRWASRQRRPANAQASRRSGATP